eukprot:11654507-Ditylum_brightwellii.AAC.1
MITPTSNPTDKPLAIPVILLSGIPTPKHNKDLQDKSQHFEIQTSNKGTVTNMTPSPKGANTDIFNTPKEFKDFHNKINKELNEIKDQIDIRLVDIKQKLKTFDDSTILTRQFLLWMNVSHQIT